MVRLEPTKSVSSVSSVSPFERAQLPLRFCNLDRLLYTMKTRGLDGIVACAPNNVFYLTGFNAVAHKADEPRPYEVKPVTIDTDLGFSFETDIQYGSWVFRPRSPKHPGMMRWCRERGLAEGDTLVLERTGDYRYRLSLEKGTVAPSE